MVEAIQVILFPHIARGQTTACAGFRSPRALVWCSVACAPGNHPGNAVVGFTLDVLPFLMRCDDGPGSQTKRVTISSDNLPSESTPGDSFRNWVWTNMSKSSSMCIHSNWWILPLLYRFLLFWSRITFTHHMKWSSRVHNETTLIRRSFEGEETLIAGTWFEEPTSILRIWTWNFVPALVKKNQAAFLVFLSRSKSTRLIVLRMLERLDLADFEMRSGWLQLTVPIVPFVQSFVREMKSHSSLGLVIRLNFPNLHLSFIIQRNVNYNRCWLFFASAGFAACLYAHLSPNLELRILYIREHANKYMNFTFGNFPLLKFAQDSLFAFPDGFSPVNVDVPSAFPSSLPFPSPFEFWFGEPVGESEQGRPFPLPFMFGSRLNAHASPKEQWPFVIQRVQSLLLELFLAYDLPIPFALPLLRAPNASLTSSRFLALKWESLIFVHEISLDRQLQSARIIFLVADCRLLNLDLHQVFQFFRLFNLHLVQTLQHVVSRSVNDCW